MWWREVLSLTALAIDNFIKIKVLSGPNIYSCCLASGESIEHVFICYVASVGWHGISKWGDIPHIFVYLVQDVFEIHKYVPGANIKERWCKLLL